MLEMSIILNKNKNIGRNVFRRVFWFVKFDFLIAFTNKDVENIKFYCLSLNARIILIW